jgi:hypothetical protein
VCNLTDLSKKLEMSQSTLKMLDKWIEDW